MSTLNYIDENGNINKAGVIPKNYPASNIKMANGESAEDAVGKLKTFTVLQNITTDGNGIYTSDIPYTKCVKSAYTSSGYMAIPFIATNVWKFQLLTNNGNSFVNGANVTTNLAVYLEE